MITGCILRYVEKLELVIKNLQDRSPRPLVTLAKMSSLFRRPANDARTTHMSASWRAGRIHLLLVPHAYVGSCVFGGQFIISFVICIPIYNITFNAFYTYAMRPLHLVLAGIGGTHASPTSLGNSNGRAGGRPDRNAQLKTWSDEYM